MTPTAVILDTNVFVAAAFRARSASAAILRAIRSGSLRLVWNDQTRSETRYILEKIPRLSWSDVEDLFRDEDRYDGPTEPAGLTHIPDHDDRKFAALAEAAGAVLLTNDRHLLSGRDKGGAVICTPREYWHRWPDARS